MPDDIAVGAETRRWSTRRKCLIGILLLGLVALSLGGGWRLGVMSIRREYRQNVVPRNARDWLGYAEWARYAGVVDLAERMEDEARAAMMLTLFRTDSAAELSDMQREALRQIKGYDDRHGLGAQEKRFYGPGYENLRNLLEAVPWAPKDARRRAFAAKYRKEVPDLAPSLDDVAWLTNTDGPPDLDDKVVLVDFWGLRCGPCIVSLPHVQELWETYRERGLAVVALHCQKRKDERVKGLVQEKKWSFPVGQVGAATCGEFWVQSLPAYYLIDRAGRLVCGPVSELPDRSRIEELLAAKREPSGSDAKDR